MRDTNRVHVIIVHYRSGGTLLALLDDLAQQRDVSLDVTIVECGVDGTVSEAASRHRAIRVLEPGGNLGYSGGNNFALSRLEEDQDPILIVNPDVRLDEADLVFRLVSTLAQTPRLAAVAPSIKTPDGAIEYTGSLIDLDRATAVHTGTHLTQWPCDSPRLVPLSWIDGACWLLRRAALADVGALDDRFFLFSEEVDWCIRARDAGWHLGVLRDVSVTHARSSSFGTSPKWAYYMWRNSYLLSFKHADGWRWRWHWVRGLVSFWLRRRNIRSGAAAYAVRGGLHALTGRWGQMPGDA